MKNSRTTSIVSCIGIIGLGIAVLFGVRNYKTRYYIRQSLNALICTTTVSIPMLFLLLFMGVNIVTITLGMIVLIYNVSVYLQIIRSAFDFVPYYIWGLEEFF